MQLTGIESANTATLLPALWAESAYARGPGVLDRVRDLFYGPTPDEEQTRREVITSWRDLAASVVVAKVEAGIPLSAALDETLEETAYGQIWVRVCQLPTKPTEYLNVWARFPKALRIHSSIWADLKRGTRLSNVMTMAIARVSAAGTSSIRSEMSMERRRAQPVLWFMEDASLPLELVDALLGIRRAEAALMTIDGLTLPYLRRVGLLREIVPLWVASLQPYLRWLASIPAAEIGRSVVPENERIDIDAAYAKRRQKVTALRAVAQK